MKKHYVNEKKVSNNHSTLDSFGIIFCIILPVYLLLLKFVSNLFKIQGLFHWFPIVVSVLAFLFVGAMLGSSIDYNEIRFLQKQTLTGHPSIEGKVQYWHFLDPIGKTKNEIKSELDKRFKEKNYQKKGLIKIAIYLTIGLIILIVGCFINNFVLNALVAYPAIIIISFTTYSPTADSFLNKLFRSEKAYLDQIIWPDCICPKCGALCDPDVTKTSNKKSVSWDSIYTTTTTDKYTDGYNTLYVDRTHVGVAQNEETSWKENHYCTRCKHSFSKSNGYTITKKKS